jgi:phage repressor protein C with HTH and peptisase S24 domain
MSNKMPAKTIDSDKEAFKERFRTVASGAGGPKRFAELTGISYASTRKYMDGTDPSRAALSKIVTHLSVDAQWLLTGHSTEGADSGVKIVTQDVRPAGKTVAMPFFNYSEYRKHLLEKFDFQDRAAGIERLMGSRNEMPSHEFDQKTVERAFPRGIGSIFCYQVDDHLMFPDLPEGSMVLLDVSQSKISPGRTYLLRYDDSPIIRKVIPTEDASGWELVGGQDEAVIRVSKRDIIKYGSVIALVTHVFKRL